MSIDTSIVDAAIHVDTMIKHVMKLSVEMSNYCNKSVLKSVSKYIIRRYQYNQAMRR
jgi:hypothetical protein